MSEQLNRSEANFELTPGEYYDGDPSRTEIPAIYGEHSAGSRDNFPGFYYQWSAALTDGTSGDFSQTETPQIAGDLMRGPRDGGWGDGYHRDAASGLSLDEQR